MSIEGKFKLNCQDCNAGFAGRINIYHEDYDELGVNTAKYSVHMARDTKGGAISDARDHHRTAASRHDDGYRDYDKPEHKLFNLRIRNRSVGILHVSVGFRDASVYGLRGEMRVKVEDEKLHRL